MPEAVRFDFSGFDSFGRIARTLASGEEPSAAEWDALFAVPGYAALTRSEFSRETIENRLRLACDPALSTERAEALAANKSALLAHFVSALSRWAGLEAAASRIASAGLQRKAVELACQLLPIEQLVANSEALPECPPVSFLIFVDDARGYEPVVFDMAFAAGLSERDLTLLMAHEFHHYYRNRILSFQREAAPDGSDKLLWVVDQIHAEGVADLINVPEQIYGDGPWAAGAGSAAYRAAVEAAPQFLRRLDEDLARIQGVVASGGTPSDPAGAASDIAAVSESLAGALPRSGHPIGYYMASFLRRRGCEAGLVDTVGNPFAFFNLYAQEASKAGMPAFSAAARATLAWLGELCTK